MPDNIITDCNVIRFISEVFYPVILRIKNVDSLTFSGDPYSVFNCVYSSICSVNSLRSEVFGYFMRLSFCLLLM